MDASNVPAILCSSERASHLALALHDLLQCPLPPEALLPLGEIAGVLYQEACDSADTLGDMLGTSAASARHGRSTD